MPPKRKRPTDIGGLGGRPSPHRPDQTVLGQHDRGAQDGGSRGARGGRNTRRNDRRDSAQAAANMATPISPLAQRRPSLPSQAVQPPTPITMAPTAPQATDLPRPIPSSYLYTIITDAQVSDWANTGRQEVLNHGIQSRDDEDTAEVSAIFEELLHSVLSNRLDAKDCGSLIKEIIGEATGAGESPEGAFDPVTTFLDGVSIALEGDSGVQNPRLGEYMAASGIPASLMRQVLDQEVLMQLGYIRETFPRMSVRYATNLLYRQQSYNLLREETEGFAKLMNELYTSSFTAGQEISFQTAHATFERIKGLIGTFDLDVGRVLDITLDVFAATIIKQFRFFVKFLRLSSWWPRDNSQPPSRSFLRGLPRWADPDFADDDTLEEEQEADMAGIRQERDIQFWNRARQMHIDAFYQLGDREVADENAQETANENGSKSNSSEAELAWIETTKTKPPPGNRVAAQILGFKLRFYTSDISGNEDIPANMLYLAALLIKIGFISLCDLYPHLYPADEDMEKVREKRIEELDEIERRNRPGGAKNALMMAGALSDDTVPGSSNRRETAASKTDPTKSTDPAATTDATKQPSDQKVQLLIQLLTIGCIPESLFIIGRFPWLPQLYGDKVLPLIHRILTQSIEKVANEANPASDAHVSRPSQVADADQSGMPKGHIRLSELPLRRPLRWPYPDQRDVGEGQNYRFYFDEWADNIPVCQTVDDIFTLCSTLLNVSGVNIGRDPDLLQNFARIGVKSLREDTSEQNRTRWLDLLKRLLVPALSLTPANAACVQCVWDLLRQFPTPVRYNIYAEWYEGATSRLEPIKRAFAQTKLETLSVMKRLSLKNIPSMARLLAKTAYASPGVVFKVALDQVEAYSNLIQVFVECAKYFTEMGYDILVWSLMSSLGGKQRSRTQETSVLLTSKWLQALSKFSGSVFKRYSTMDPTPIVQYVNDQLFKGNSTDLVILKELIMTMGGLVSDVDFTDAQILALSGGESLRRQTLIGLGDKRSESRESSKRLISALIETKLVGRLLINIAQYRYAGISKLSEDESHIKFIATMVDDAQEMLVQYLDFLRSNLDPIEFEKLLPSIEELVGDFGIDTSLAFMIGRYGLSYHMLNPKVRELAATLDVPATQNGPDADGDTSMDGFAAAAAANGQVSSPKDSQGDRITVDESSAPDTSLTSVVNGTKNDTMLDTLQPIISCMQSNMPAENWQHLTPEFYVVFWALQLGDLLVPEPAYIEEHNRLKKAAEEVMRDRSDMTRAGMNKKNQKKESLLNDAKVVRDEMMAHAERKQKTKLRLMKHANTWLTGSAASSGNFNAVADALLEQCILPRILLSATDTEFSLRMIKFLHENRVANFKLMTFYERLFNSNRLRALIFTTTVREAEHLGRFLKGILSDLSRWHEKKAVYEKEALGQNKDGRRSYLGFATEVDKGGTPKTFVEHPQFRDLLYGWHRNLNKALKECLENSEWMHIRNAITVLKTVVEFFPAVDFMGKMFSETLMKITEREAASKTTSESEAGHRVDLSVAAQTAASALQKRKKNWVMVQAFRTNAVSSTARL